jgi:hypothetical protein
MILKLNGVSRLSNSTVLRNHGMISRFLLGMLLAIPLLAAAQDAAFTNRSTELKDRGDAGARTITTLSENTPVKVLARGGAWTQVEAGGQSGWVGAFHLRFPSTVESASSSGGGGFLSSLGSAIGGQRSNTKANLSTTGVRGLTKEELQNSNPDPEQLRRMQSFRADRAAAERFAREGKLAAVQIDIPGDAPATPKGGRR